MLNRLSFAFARIWRAAIFSLFLCLSPHSSEALIGDSLGISPFWNWKEIKTPHFRVTFPEHLDSTARKAAVDLEDAHRILSHDLRWKPRTRTQVLLIDNSDLANGLATPFQRFGMVLYAVPPDNTMSIGYYDDWLRLLAIHEYTHVLNMDAVTGVYEGLRLFFGDLFLPNLLWPRWMLEGLAVYTETRLTGAGRGRSPYYEMILRTAVKEDLLKEDKFMSLGRLGGENPYPPGGEHHYLFGYYLMNAVARENGYSALGEMSYRSAGRVPYFINGNLSNITGKNWYEYWDQWVDETQVRMQADIQKIKSEPLTFTTKERQSGFSALGNAPSPDGEWLAFNETSLERRAGLHLKNLRTQETVRIDDKIEGASLAFTPDSRFLVFSRVSRQNQYYLVSDLAAYDLKDETIFELSEDLRAKDPDISRDGKWIAFTLTRTSTVHLALAPLRYDAEGRPSLGANRILFEAPPLARVSTPKFSADGRRVFFSLKRNGSRGEEIASVDLASGKSATLVSDGNFNRFPAVDSGGELYFISNRTGVDNLFRHRTESAPEQVTNTLTGFWLPSFARGKHGEQDVLFVSEYTAQGWDLSRVAKLSEKTSSQEVTVTQPTAPKIVSTPTQRNLIDEKSLEVRDYSIFPSILPRQWAPLLISLPQGTAIGGNIFGFDATDRHRYLLAGLYRTDLGAGDWAGFYSNRSLGPTLTLSGSATTSQPSSDYLSYRRSREFNLSVSFPFQWTFSTLDWRMGLGGEREFRVFSDTGESIPLTGYVPEVETELTFSNAESSRLAIGAERGRTLRLGGRSYLFSGTNTYKGLFSYTEYLPITDHSTLFPVIKGAMTSRIVRTPTEASAFLEGRGNSLLSPFEGDSLDQLQIRGYPGQAFKARSAIVGSLNYRFPLWNVFRGWGTNPLFFEQLYGFTFAEAATFPSSETSPVLPSAGGGLRLTSQVLNMVPLNLSVEYHHGFNQEFNGTGEVFFAVNLGAFNF